MVRPPHSPGGVVRCSNCGFVYVARLESTKGIIEGEQDLPPQPERSSDLPLSAWMRSELPEKLLELPALRRNYQDALGKITPHCPPGKLLDFGCGWGFFLQYAREQGWDCCGLEPRSRLALFTQTRLGISVTPGVLREDSFPPGHFDGITAFQVFEHLLDPAAALAQLHAILKPGGVLLIEVPNIATWSVHLLRSRHRHFSSQHINFFSPDTLKNLLQSNGYAHLETYFPTRYLTVYHLAAYWFRRLLPGNLAAQILQQAQKRKRLQNVISINTGDILAVVAQKPLKYTT